MRSLNTIIEGLFDVEGSVGVVDRKDAIADELAVLGMNTRKEIDGVFYCNINPLRYTFNNPKIKKYPKELDTLAIIDSGATITVAGDLKNSNINQIQTDAQLIFKVPKVRDIKFGANGLNIYGDPYVGGTKLVFKSIVSEVSNCEFANTNRLMFDASIKFVNCDFLPHDNNITDIGILFHGDQYELARWLHKICGAPDTVARFATDNTREIVERMLGHYGIDVKRFNNTYIHVVCDDPERAVHMAYGNGFQSYGWVNDKLEIRDIKRLLK